MRKGIVGLLLCVVLLAMVPVSAEAKHVPIYADPTPPTAITIDGMITAEEWGEPTAVFTYDDLKNGYDGWTCWRFFGSATEMEKQSIELYARRDSENLYFGFRFVMVHHIDQGDYGRDIWRYAGLKLAIGAFDPETNIETDENGERWLSYHVRQWYDAQKEVFVPEFRANGNIGLDSYKLPNAAIYTDEDELIYDYEIVLPYADLYGVITAETEDIVLSYELTDARMAGEDSGNRWFVSEAIRKATEDKEPQAFLACNPVRLIYAEEPEPVPEEPETPAQPEPATDSFPWYIPVIAVAAIGVVVAVVIVIKHVRKEIKK